MGVRQRQPGVVSAEEAIEAVAMSTRSPCPGDSGGMTCDRWESRVKWSLVVAEVKLEGKVESGRADVEGGKRSDAAKTGGGRAARAGPAF